MENATTMDTSSPSPSLVDQIDLYPCANATTKCKNAGTKTCTGCQLVAYCSPDCQMTHWKLHRHFCRKSVLAKESWDPAWFRDGRNPVFKGKPKSRALDTTTTYLWGKVPALDHVNLPNNEGIEWKQDLNLCFVASGDLRNVIASVNNLPDTYNQQCKMDINDPHMHVVLRNILLLLTFSSFPHAPSEVAQMALHLWYSARLPKVMGKKLRDTLLEKLEGVSAALDTDKASGADGILSTTFKLGEKSKMKCVIPRAYWGELMRILRSEVTLDEAIKKRNRIMLSKERQDYREHRLFMLPTGYRHPKFTYYEDGLLLPFGADRSDFTDGNFTLFRTDNKKWLLRHGADPLNGWNPHAVYSTLVARALPTNDIYGALYYHLLREFRTFSSALHTRNLTFTLYSVAPTQLADSLLVTKRRAYSFDRIDVSNLCDPSRLGLNPVLTIFSPLLNVANPHSTLLSLFIEYAGDPLDLDSMKLIHGGRECRELSRLFPTDQREPRSEFDPNLAKHHNMKAYLRDYRRIWDEYRRTHAFGVAARGVECKQREPGKIVIARPYEVKRGGRVMEQLLALEVAGLVGCECWVEWVRASS